MCSQRPCGLSVGVCVFSDSENFISVKELEREGTLIRKSFLDF